MILYDPLSSQSLSTLYIDVVHRTSPVVHRTSYIVRRPSVVPRDYISQEPPLELFRHHSTEAWPELVVAKSTELGLTCNTPRHGIITAAVQPIRIFPLIWRFKTMHNMQTDLNRLTLVYMVPIYSRAAVQNRNS